MAEKQGRGRSGYSESCCHCQRPFEGLVLGMAGRQDKLEMQCVCFLGAPNRDEHQGCRRKCSCCEMPKMINPCTKVEAEPSGYDFMIRASLSPRCPRRRSVLGQVWSSPVHWVKHSLQPQHLRLEDQAQVQESFCGHFFFLNILIVVPYKSQRVMVIT